MFSKKEFEILRNQDFFRQKHKIIQQFYEDLGKMIVIIKNDSDHLDFNYPEGTDVTIGKISKGEHYHYLPYLMADFPRNFAKRGIFVFRTWFWWGNYVLFIWHFSGEQLKSYESLLLEKFSIFQENECYLSIGTDEWQHHLDSESYSEIKKMTFEQFKRYVNGKPFVKIVQKLELEDLCKLQERGLSAFKMIIKNSQ
jgi:hypothetical protein